MGAVTKRVSKYKNAKEESASRIVELKALTDNQATYLKALRFSNQVIVTGCAGTGKTYMAATHAANLYADNKIDKIVITRPIVPVGRDLGYFKGDLKEKYAPWAAPVMDVLVAQLGAGVVESGLNHGNIEAAPLATMRGRSFNNAFMLLDEAQNTTLQEFKMFLTRIGKNTSVVINGDLLQSDLESGSGLSYIINMAKKYNMDIPVIEFGIEDIVRSDICKQWIIAFSKEKL